MRGKRVASQRKGLDRSDRGLENRDGVGAEVIEGSVQ